MAVVEGSVWSSFDVSPDAVVVADAVGTVRYANPAAAEVFGAVPPAGLIGRNLLELVHPDDVDRAFHALASSTAQPGRNPVIDMRFRRLDGVAFRGEIASCTLPDGGIVLSGRTADAIAELDRMTDLDAERLRHLLQHVPTAVLLVDADGVIAIANHAAARVLRVDPGRITGAAFAEVFGADDLLVPGATATTHGRQRVRLPSGATMLVDVVDERFDPALRGWVVTAADVTALEEAERVAAEETERNRRLVHLLEATSDLVAVCGLDGTVSFGNPALALRLGDVPDIRTVLDEGRWEDQVLPSLLAQGVWQGETAGGRLAVPVDLSVMCTLQLDADGVPEAVAFVARDIGTLVLEQRRLADVATTDPLTGLRNRRGLDTALQQLATTGRSPVAALLIDLDGFKPVNDVHGHDVGDEVLRACGERLLGAVRPGDVVGRLGGDEFVVVIPGCDAASAVVAASRIEAAITRPIETAAGAVQVGASVGIGIAAGLADVGALLRRADEAMYAVKRSRRRDRPDQGR